MRKLVFWMVFLAVGQFTWAQKDSTVKVNYKPWIVVNKMDNRAGDIEGKLFVEHLSPLKKRLIQRRLEHIKKGQVSLDYRMKFHVSREK